jgi:hypothetical protein
MVVIVRLMTADLVTDALEMATSLPPTRSRVIARCRQSTHVILRGAVS